MTRVLLGIVLVGLLAYAAACVLVYSRQRDLVYYGAATRADAATTDFALRRDGGVVLRGWVSNPGRRDVLLHNIPARGSGSERVPDFDRGRRFDFRITAVASPQLDKQVQR